MKRKCLRLVASVGFTGLLCGASAAFAQTAPSLGAAQSFGVLSGTASVSNTGASVVNGDLGTSGVAGITGFPPGIVTGSTHNNDALAIQAQLDAITAAGSALHNLQGQGCTTNYPPIQDIGTFTLGPGVYCFASSAGITGTVTLDAGGNPNAVFIFIVGSALTAEVNSVVFLKNGAQACNVFWAIGSSATVKVGSTFVGNILSTLDITGQTSAHFFGRILAGRAVVLDTNVVDATVCAGVGGGGGTPAPAPCVPSTAGLPTITTIPSQVIPVLPVGGSVAVGFTIGGAVITDALKVVATSSDTTLVPPSAMVITKGIGGARVLTIFGADGRSGVATITVTVTDPTNTLCTVATSTTFKLTIGTAVPTLPQWAMIALTALLALAGFAAVRRRAT